MKRLADQSLYEILEVREDAPASEIAVACDRARDIYGPGSLATYSLMTPDEAELLTKRIDEARATLLDPDARARYDGSLRRTGEAVAVEAASIGSIASASVAAGPLASLPPVIPALRSPPPMAAREPVAAPAAVAELERASSPESAATPGPVAAPKALPLPEPEEQVVEGEETEEEALPSARPAILLATAVEAAGAPEGAAAPPPEPPSPMPILLQRELPPSPVAEAAAPAAPAPSAPEPVVAPPAAPAPAAEQPMVPDGAWTGEALRRAREARGLTVQQIAERTKVTRHHIENIEEERFGALPAPVYLRGILLSIARELRLDGQKVARAFLERTAAAQAKPR